MVIKIKLKNSGNFVLVDHRVYDELAAIPYFSEHAVLENLREHSTGIPVFQKFIRLIDGKCKVRSIYLNSFIAKKYVAKPAGSRGRLFITYLNGNKLDCRLKNLRWDTMANLSRERPTHHNRTGFRGVRKTPDGKFVAMISDRVKQIYLGTFFTADEAAMAYNNKSIELFGRTGSLNKVDESGNPVPTERKVRSKSKGESASKSSVVKFSEYDVKARTRKTG